MVLKTPIENSISNYPSSGQTGSKGPDLCSSGEPEAPPEEQKLGKGDLPPIDLPSTPDPCRLEGPPSYKPPTPKAKLEEPEMVSCSPRIQAALPPYPAFLSGVKWEGLLSWDGPGWEQQPSGSWLTLVSFHSPLNSSLWGPRSTAQ